jgi:hypothetical protein
MEDARRRCYLFWLRLLLAANQQKSRQTAFFTQPTTPPFTKRPYPTLRDGTTRVSDEISQNHDCHQCSNTPKPTIQVWHPTELTIIVEFASRTVFPPLCGETFIPNLFAGFLMFFGERPRPRRARHPIQPRGHTYLFLVLTPSTSHLPCHSQR